MDCKTARLLLDFARPKPAELAGGDAADLEGHLGACPECDAVGRGQRQLDDHIGRAVRDVPLPDGLRDRLLERLAAERRAWKRRLAKRAVPLAAAAAVLLAVGLYAFWPRHQLPAPDLDAKVGDISWNDNSRGSAAALEEWFHTKYPGWAMVAPREAEGRALDYRLLVYADLADFQGQRVPLLLFSKEDKLAGNKQARVYVLSQKHFKLDELLQLPPMNSKGYTVVVSPCPDDTGLVFIFIYTGNSMAPFLIGPPPVNG
jgi:hypothetical protein